MQLILPTKLERLFQTNKRFVVIYGGRGSGKSYNVALYLIYRAINSKTRILCGREIQNSIRDSVHKILCDMIERLGVGYYFTITRDSITAKNGSEFMFKGLWNNINSIKSTEGVDLCWIEEAQSVSRTSLDILTPTIRKPGSQIIFTYNPTNDNDPVHVDFMLPNRDDVELIQINYSDNPYFPDVLKNELEYDKLTDYDKYLHKWEGHCIAHSEAQIFHGKWEVKDFETPDGVRYLFGADWGFAKDPTALIKLFIHDNCLYIDSEAYGVGVGIEATPAMFDMVDGSRDNKIIADNARPELIDYMNSKGFFVVPAEKGKNSVVEGIQRIRSFYRIYIHPRCKHTIDEFRFYCYKVHAKTEQVSNIPEDKHNHIIDAIRYATEGQIVGIPDAKQLLELQRIF